MDLGNWLKKLDEQIEPYLASIFLIIFSLLTFVQVVMRYVLQNPLTWTEELCRFAFIWFVYMSASYAVKYQRHVKFSFFVDLLPKRLKWLFKLLALLLWLGFLLFLDFYSFKVVGHLFTSMQTSPALQLPMYVIYLAVPIGSIMMTIRVLQHIARSLTTR